MKSLVLVLVILSFIQSSIVSLDLVLIALICRSYIKNDSKNFYLAFGFGLLNSYLTLTPLGLQSIIYLILIAITLGLSKSRLAGNALLIIPLTFILVSINHIAIATVTSQSFQLSPKNLIESILALPILFVVRMWEERFIVRGDIKLRI